MWQVTLVIFIGRPSRCLGRRLPCGRAAYHPAWGPSGACRLLPPRRWRQDRVPMPRGEADADGTGAGGANHGGDPPLERRFGAECRRPARPRRPRRADRGTRRAARHHGVRGRAIELRGRAARLHGAGPMNAPVGSDLTALSMTEAADAFAAGEVKAEALVRASLARIAAHDGKVNAVIRLEAEAALEAARAQDKARAAGATPGRLAGAPMMHKDMYYRAGKVSTCGSAIRRDFVPKVTATVLQRLDAAGAIDMGTLNMAEFAQNPTGHNAHFGHCHNPWNLDYCTGGSSSGSGAGVAARFFTAALGSDTGGSIRLPATLCGVTGLKATQTRVSRAGVMPLSFSADNVGPL